MKKAVVFTLGCKVNECESDSLITGLKELGGANADYWNCNYLFMFNKAETT